MARGGGRAGESNSQPARTSGRGVGGTRRRAGKTTKTEILRHAISLEQRLDHEIDRGARILIEKDDKFSELLLRP